MKTTIKKWGKSLAVRIPKSLVQQAGFIEGTHVKLDYRKGVLAVRLGGSSQILNTLIEGITPNNLHEADTCTPIGKEFW